jgi:uncharacterized delta-60 repeat protein
MKSLVTTVLSLLLLFSCYAQDGTLDPAFGANGKLTTNFGLPWFKVTSGCVQADGKIIVAGSATNDPSSNAASNLLVRFNANGDIDNSFGVNGIVYTSFAPESSDIINKVVILPGGKILTGGTASYNGTVYIILSRYTSNGQPDNTFGTNGQYQSTAECSFGDMAVQTDGKVVVCGALNYNAPAFNVYRVDTDGTNDNTFQQPSLSGPVYDPNAIFLQSDGKIIIGGSMYDDFEFSNKQPFLLRLQDNGVADNSFGTSGLCTIPVVDVDFLVKAQPDNQDRILVLMADPSQDNDSMQLYLKRYTSNGAVDPSFGTAGTVTLSNTVSGLFSYELPAFQVLANNKILFGGTTAHNQHVREMAAIRLDTDGQQDVLFGTNGKAFIPSAPDAYEGAVSIPAPDGSVFIAGYNFSHGRYGLALGRLHDDGTPDNNFSTDAKASAFVGNGDYTNDGFSDMLVHSTGTITAAGYARNGLYSSICVTQFNSNGQIDNTFGASGRTYLSLRDKGGFNRFSYSHEMNNIIALKKDPAGNLFIICDEYDLNTRAFHPVLHKLTVNGLLDLSFGYGGKVMIDPISGYNSKAIGLAIQADGKPVIAGYINHYINDSSNIALIRLKLNGETDSTFGTNGWVFDKNFTNNDFYITNMPNRLVVQPDDKILLTSQLKATHNWPFAIARYTANGAVDNSFHQTGIVVTDLADNSDGYSTAIALQADGKILLGGSSVASAKCIVRYNQNGNPDSSFGTNGIRLKAGKGATNSVLLQPDGKILLMGDAYDQDNKSYIHASRLYANGKTDSSFGTGGHVSLPASSPFADLAGNIGVTPTGQILIAGTTDNEWGGFQNIPSSVIYSLNNTLQYCTSTTVNAGRDTIICPGATQGVTLGAAAVTGATYSWAPSAGLNDTAVAKPIAKPGITTTYIVTLTTSGGCEAKDTVKVTILTPVVPAITTSGTTAFCSGSSVSLSTLTGATFQWLKDSVAINTATNNTYSVTEAGKYTVAVVDANGCKDTSAATPVTVYPLPAKPVLTQIGNVLSAPAATGYQWYLNGSILATVTTQTYAYPLPGSYTVIVTNSNNCKSVLSDPIQAVMTGINSPELEKKMLLGPNPVTDQLLIRYTGNYAVFDVTVLDVAGQHVMAQGKFSSSIQFNMKPYPAGMYIIQIKNNKTGEFLQKKVFKN